MPTDMFMRKANTINYKHKFLYRVYVNMVHNMYQHSDILKSNQLYE